MVTFKMVAYLKKKAKPRIALIIRDLHKLGGAQLNSIRLASRLRQMGHEVLIIGYGTRKKVSDYFSRYGIETDLLTCLIPPPDTGLRKILNRWPNIFFLVPCLFQLWKRRSQYDLVHGSLLMESGMVCAFAAMLFHKPSLVKLGSAGIYGDVQRAYKNSLKRLLKKLYTHINKFVCLTHEIEIELSTSLGINNIKLIRIPNGVDIDFYFPATEEEKLKLKRSFGLDKHGTLALFAGRLEVKKRLNFLLDAWRIVCQDNNNHPHLVIIGEGSLRKELDEYVHKLKLDRRVTFYGESGEIASLMRAADIFILPSVSEGIANVLLESMATALPIVATDTVGNNEILAHRKSALLFSENRRDKLAESILYLLKNPESAQKIGAAGRKTVEKKYCIQRIAEAYSALYLKLIECSARAAGRL
ncbi:glycosyltransferase family 4 protein [Thermodesulfobacteriota bacterium]